MFNLHTRQKLLKLERELHKGDLVILETESTPRMAWTLGLILSIEKGEDDLVRTVEVETARGITKRDIRKVFMLEGADDGRKDTG